MSAAALDAHVVVDRPGFRLDVALTAAAGDVVAVMGPSGAGKSTLLGALAGLVRTTGVRIRIGDRTVDEAGRRGIHVPPMRRGAVLLGQQPRLFPHMTAAENVAFALRTHGATRSDARTGAATWLARVGLPGSGTRRPAELSGGQQQRVALARALAAAPSVVLLDEPLTSLDPETAADIRTVLAEQLAASGTTAVVVTHDAVDAVGLAGRLVIVEHGIVTQQGATRDVLSVPETRFAAALAGLERLEGVARGGAFVQEASGIVLRPGDAASVEAAAQDGAELAAILAPTAVGIAPSDGSPIATDRTWDAWRARVVRLEATIGGVRVVTEPVDAAASGGAGTVAAEVAVSDVVDLGLLPGATVVLRVERRRVRLRRI